MVSWRECHWPMNPKSNAVVIPNFTRVMCLFTDSRAFDDVHWFGLACLVFYLLESNCLLIKSCLFLMCRSLLKNHLAVVETLSSYTKVCRSMPTTYNIDTRTFS